MNKLLSYNAALRDNLLPLIGICLCFYFSYHAVLGQRSLVRLLALEQKIETMSLEKDSLTQERATLQQKVEMMRPGHVDRDLLEERVRVTLGYRASDEYSVISN